MQNNRSDNLYERISGYKGRLLLVGALATCGLASACSTVSTEEFEKYKQERAAWEVCANSMATITSARIASLESRVDAYQRELTALVMSRTMVAELREDVQAVKVELLAKQKEDYDRLNKEWDTEKREMTKVREHVEGSINTMEADFGKPTDNAGEGSGFYAHESRLGKLETSLKNLRTWHLAARMYQNAVNTYFQEMKGKMVELRREYQNAVKPEMKDDELEALKKSHTKKVQTLIKQYEAKDAKALERAEALAKIGQEGDVTQEEGKREEK